MRHNFRELTIWKESLNVTKQVYLFCANLPEDEKFGLKSQMQRSAVSIASNIAEGSGRTTDKDFNKFLDYSLSSSYELETQILLSKELFNFDVEDILKELNVTQKRIGAFKRTLRN